jgi:excinuclease UvrABC helicase subunit UvrB
MREAVLEFHHLDPAVKTFSLAHGTERSLREMIEEAHKTICLCKWSHDQTKGYRGQLSEYGQRLPVAVAERLDAFSANRVVGAGPTYLREDQPQTGNV